MTCLATPHSASISDGELPLDSLLTVTTRCELLGDFYFSRTKVDTVLPLSEPVQCANGTVVAEVPVPKGTDIFINLRACNTNKALWGEDAREWKPERWLKPLPKAVEDARIPGIYAHLCVSCRWAPCVLL